MPRKHYDRRAAIAKARQRLRGTHMRWTWIHLGIFGDTYMDAMKRIWRPDARLDRLVYGQSKLFAMIEKDDTSNAAK